MVCHGDPNLVRPSGDATQSLFIDVAMLQQSAHKDTPCTGCHIDFAYKTPHQNVANGDDWRAVARQACKNCKDHGPQFTEVAGGAHSPAGKPGQEASVTAAIRQDKGLPNRVPSCGDCHGSHAIPSMDDTAAVTQLRLTALEMCGTCHEEYARSYDDYYHGAAYRQGAKDAPTCWDCHGAHELLPSMDKRSPVNDNQLYETCGQCHEGLDNFENAEEYISYTALVHRGSDVRAEVPLYALIDSTRSAVREVIRTVTSWFSQGEA